MKENLSFWKWAFNIQNISVLGMAIFFIIITLINWNGFDPIAWGYGILGFFVFIISIFVYKTFQHWNDLKKGRSR